MGSIRRLWSFLLTQVMGPTKGPTPVWVRRTILLEAMIISLGAKALTSIPPFLKLIIYIYIGSIRFCFLDLVCLGIDITKTTNYVWKSSFSSPLYIFGECNIMLRIPIKSSKRDRKIAKPRVMQIGERGTMDHTTQ